MNTGLRIDYKHALSLLKDRDILEIAAEADNIRRGKHPDNIVTFIVDRNINYTNICSCQCKFCAFYREDGDADAFVMSREELENKISDTIENGGTQILIQGGLHPGLDICWYEDMLRYIKQNFNIWVHGFSAPEIVHISRVSRLTVRDTISRLIDAGLDSIPGGGAEVLADEVRLEISPNKITSGEWIDVMRQAHSFGMRTTATMMFRAEEKPEYILEHMFRIRELQDETGGFTAFIPWPFQPGNTALGGRSATSYEYLRVLAASRIILDNIDNIQVSWVTQGEKIGQLGLFFGANDFGSVMMEENVVKAAGAYFRLKTDDIIHQIKAAGFVPKIRNMQYEIIS